MFQNILGFTSNSTVEMAMRVGMFMIAATFLTLLAVRLTMSMVSVARVKARKEWIVEPVAGEEQSLVAELLFGRQEPSMKEEFLSDDVRRLLGKPRGSEN